MEKQALPNEPGAVTAEGCLPETETKRLRAACAELTLAGALLLSDVSRQAAGWNEASQAKASEERMRKALEIGREALS